MYNQRFVISLLVNGQVQKEFNDGVVELPFDTEFTLRLRNKHKDRRSVCKLFIDGDERSKNGYVIPANSYVDIRNDSYGKGFLFVHPESVEAQDEGKDRRNTERLNGVIEGRFYLEKEREMKEVHHHHHYPHPFPTWTPYYAQSNEMLSLSDAKKSGGICGQSAGGQHVNSTKASMAQPPVSDAEDCSFGFAESSRQHRIKRSSANRETIAGVTVDAGDKGQRYRAIDIDLEADFVPVKLFLKGILGTETSEVAEVVDSGKAVSGSHCTNCGANRKPRRAKFCGNCGHKF